LFVTKSAAKQPPAPQGGLLSLFESLPTNAQRKERSMFNLPPDTTAVLLLIVGLVLANCIGIAVQMKKLPKEENEK